MSDQIAVAQFCPQCGKGVDSDARFCKYCATSLTPVEESRSEPPLISQSAFPSTKEKVEKHERIAANRKQSGISAWNEYESTKRDSEDLRRSLEGSFLREPVFRPRTQKADKLVASGAILAVASGSAFFWGMNFTSNWANKLNAGFGQVVTGQVDSTYQLAQVCVVLGAIGVIVGIVLFIVGLAQR